jgi:anti-sigma-K factor RskA
VNTGHEEFSEWAGAYAFGALEPDDRRAFERHLAECSICAHNVRSFAPIPGLLAQIDRSELDHVAGPSTATSIASRVRREEQQLRTSRKRWRIAAVCSAAAALLILGGFLITRPDSTSTDPGSPEAPIAATTVTMSQAESAAVFTSARGWGTEIHVDLAGLPPRQQYQLWVVDRTGTWSSAGTWGPTSSGGAKITGATSMVADSLDRVVVTSDDRSDVIIDASS